MLLKTCAILINNVASSASRTSATNSATNSATGKPQSFGKWLKTIYNPARKQGLSPQPHKPTIFRNIESLYAIAIGCRKRRI